MSRNRTNPSIRIENPPPGLSAFTSKRAADGFVERGRAIWLSLTKIKFLDDAERVQTMHYDREMRRDHDYWRDIARQRGGENVAFVWRGSASANGYQVMGAEVVVTK